MESESLHLHPYNFVNNRNINHNFEVSSSSQIVIYRALCLHQGGSSPRLSTVLLKIASIRFNHCIV